MHNLSRYSYVVLDDSPDYLLDKNVIASIFPQFIFSGAASNYSDGLDLILEVKPDLVFLEVDSSIGENGLSLNLINELYRYLDKVPEFVITSRNKDHAFESIKHGVFDFLPKPLATPELRKCLMRFSKNRLAAAESNVVTISPITYEPQVQNAESESIVPKNVEFAELVNPPLQKQEKPLTLCIKSYGDYRFINATDICYMQADNNSTDLHLNNGEMITAFKTLKHFENVLSAPFVRIHNSYIVNVDYLTRIHTGNSVCYIKHPTAKLPFSKSYKDNVDAILQSMANGNYLEI